MQSRVDGMEGGGREVRVAVIIEGRGTGGWTGEGGTEAALVMPWRERCGKKRQRPRFPSVWKNIAPRGPPNGAEEEDSEPLLTFQTKPRLPALRPTVLALVSGRQRGLSEHHSLLPLMTRQCQPHSQSALPARTKASWGRDCALDVAFPDVSPLFWVSVSICAMPSAVAPVKGRSISNRLPDD